MFTNIQQELFNIYADFLLSENEKYNLTAIKSYDEVFLKHFVDSVLPLDFYSLPENASVIDVGSGGGFPGVPMKILRPDISLTCIDSTGKKIDFLRMLSLKLGIDFEAIHIRAEAAGQTDIYREKYDIAVSRAVAALPVLCEFCLPLVKIGGAFLSLKGENEHSGSATSSAEKLGAVLKNTVDYKLPNGDLRRLFVFEKIAETDKKYPREFGAIKKKPL
jgi:16S rRNA (guanine527-N7)-methyltransferase